MDEIPTMSDLLERLRDARSAAMSMGGDERIAREHGRGKLTVRERVAHLFDAGSITEIGLLAEREPNAFLDGAPGAADGLVAGRARIDGRPVYFAADDATVVSGTRGLIAERKQARVLDLALRDRCPFVWLQESSAGRFQEMTGSEFAIFGGREFRSHIAMSGRVPIVAAAFGHGFGGPTFRAIISDFCPVVRDQTYLGISGPPMVRAGTGEELTTDEIGGTDVIASQLGIADHVAAHDTDCLDSIGSYLSYLPSSCWELPERVDSGDLGPRSCSLLETIVPVNPRTPYDMQRVVDEVVDAGTFFELKPDYAPSVITGLARLAGWTVGIVANQPAVMAGVIDAAAAGKIVSFVQRCDAFNVPLVFLQDQPGVMLGRAADHSGVATAVTRLVMTIGRTVVPRFSVVVRKAFGLGYLAMSGRAMDPDLFVVWPTATMTAIGPGPVVETVFAKRIAGADDPQRERAELMAEFTRRTDPYIAARAAYVDDIIEPAATRNVLVGALEASQSRLRGIVGPKAPIVP